MESDFDAGFALGGLEGRKELGPGHVYDAIVIGAGPAGLSAAIYLIRKGLDTGVIASNIGGQVAWTSSIENYLGYRLIEGVHLVERFREQMNEFDAPLSLNEEVTGLAEREGVFHVRAGERDYKARALVVATGKRPRELDVPGEKRLLGRGVAYCAICDAPLYRGKTAAVVGGGNSGLEAAIDLSRGSPRVYLFELGDRLTGDAVLVERVTASERIEVLLNTKVKEVVGGESVSGIRVATEGSGERELAVEGVFVEVGLVPNSAPFGDLLSLNGQGEIEVDCLCRTNVPGVFAAGDVTAVPYKQIVVAAGEGAKAALSAYEYLLRSGDDGAGIQGRGEHGTVQ